MPWMNRLEDEWRGVFGGRGPQPVSPTQDLFIPPDQRGIGAERQPVGPTTFAWGPEERGELIRGLNPWVSPLVEGIRGYGTGEGTFPAAQRAAQEQSVDVREGLFGDARDVGMAPEGAPPTEPGTRDAFTEGIQGGPSPRTAFGGFGSAMGMSPDDTRRAWAIQQGSGMSPTHRAALQTEMGSPDWSRRQLETRGLSTPARRQATAQRQGRAERREMMDFQREMAQVGLQKQDQEAVAASHAKIQEAIDMGRIDEHYQQRAEALSQMPGGTQLAQQVVNTQEFQRAFNDLTPEQQAGAKSLLADEIIRGLRSDKTPQEIYDEQMAMLTPGFFKRIVGVRGRQDIRDRVGA